MHRPHPFFRILIVLLIILPIIAVAREPIRPVRVSTAPVIDGILDDEAWQQALQITGFKTYDPDYGMDMSDPSRIWLAYDDRHLYFAFRCYDSETDQIKASVAARDNIRPDDWMCINLDSFNDQQSMYALYVNPLGIQMDSRLATGQEDYSFDIVWYSHGRITDQGYDIEVTLPLKSLRFSGGDIVEMAVVFERQISRRSERGTYPELDPNRGGEWLTQTAPLVYENLKQSALVEILPAVTYAQNHHHDQGKFQLDDRKGEFSLTAKIGITSDLILDGTLNPDFSQVEADAGQVDFNQRFSLFYPEKRPFFLEGRENFVFGGSASGDPLGAVVHTRTIVNPLTGVKLAGKVGRHSRLAAVYALDELSEGPDDVAHVGILRYRRNLNGDSYLGTFFTARDREHHHNRVIGTDGQLRLSEAGRLGFHGFMSQTYETDPSTDDVGYALGLDYYYNTRNWLINLRAHDLSKNFQTETGYVTRTHATRTRFSVTPTLRPDSDFFLQIQPEITNQFVYDKPSGLWENNNYILVSCEMPRNSVVWIGIAHASEIYLGQKFNRNHWVLGGYSQITGRLYVMLSYWGGNLVRYTQDPFAGHGSRVSGSVVYQPSEKFNASMDVTYNDMFRKENGDKVFDYTILRSKNTYQFNKYLFFRAIVEYNTFHEELVVDFLASFTYIPGTVLHVGYGSLYQKKEWRFDRYVPADDRFLEARRGFFFKASYLWQL